MRTSTKFMLGAIAGSAIGAGVILLIIAASKYIAGVE